MLRSISAALVAASLAMPGVAFAQRNDTILGLSPGESRTQRDATGSIKGRQERGSDGVVVERNAQGARTGTVERGSGGKHIHRDPQGKITGTTDRPR